MADECGGPSTTSGCIYNSLALRVVRRGGRLRKALVGRERKGEKGRNYGRERLSARVFSTRCTVVWYASSLVPRDRLNRILVPGRNLLGIPSGRRTYLLSVLGRKY